MWRRIKYRLIEGSNNDVSKNIYDTFFLNRGIDNYKEYLKFDGSNEIPYNLLDNIDNAINMFDKHYNCKDPIGILVDEDVDGFCSGAMMYNYIKKMDNKYPLKYILHEKAKSHGLSNDVVIPNDIKLLIIPDAGTNDCIQCNTLFEKNNIDTLILDHHEQEPSKIQNKYSVIVNNQTSDNYSNKDLCGAGIVYKFLQALDDYYWNDFADDYMDLCALANISDVMDMRSYETRYYVHKGLSNIKNKCFQALIEAQNYSMNGHINIHNISWYITSVINGCIRYGSSEDKELLFRAFIETDEKFEYKTRAKKEVPSKVIQETIYDRATRLSKNAKSRQDKAREKATETIVSKIDASTSDKIILYDATNDVDNSLTGVVAMKIADIMHKPCILLQKHISGDEIVYGGSARNIDHSPIDSFKDIVNQTSCMKGVGHAGAFGIVDLPIDKKDTAISELNEILKDVEYDTTYKCDYILNINEVTPQFISTLAGLEDYIGQGIDESIIAIENVEISTSDIQILGKKCDTYKFIYNDIEYVKFRCKNDDEILKLINSNINNIITINLVGRPCINIFNNIKTMQIVIEDVNIVNIIEDDNSDIWGENKNYDEDIAW